MKDYIAQTADNRNISYIDDDPDSVKRRAEYAGFKVLRVITLAEYEEVLNELLKRTHARNTR